MKKRLQMFEAWEDKYSRTFSHAMGVKKMIRQGLIEPDAKKIFSVEAESYESAMGAYHRFMGWEPYVPWYAPVKNQAKKSKKK